MNRCRCDSYLFLIVPYLITWPRISVERVEDGPTSGATTDPFDNRAEPDDITTSFKHDSGTQAARKGWQQRRQKNARAHLLDSATCFAPCTATCSAPQSASAFFEVSRLSTTKSFKEGR